MSNKHSFLSKANLWTLSFIGLIAFSGVVIVWKFWPVSSDSTLVLINQNGYLPLDDGKEVLLHMDLQDQNDLPTCLYEVRDLGQNNRVVLSGSMNHLGNLWNHTYYSANISTIRSAGNYSVAVTVQNPPGDEKTYNSYPFRVAQDVFDKTLEMAYQFFYYQRTGCEVAEIIPGYLGHGACHLDDANNVSDHDNPNSWRNLTGAWFDAGDYNKYNGFTLESVYALAQAFDENRAFFSQESRRSLYPNTTAATYHSNQIPDIIEEAIWGADFVFKCILDDGSMIGRVGSNDVHGWYGYWGLPEEETDNDNSTPLDNRKFEGIAGNPFNGIAALLKLARIFDDYNWFPERANAYRNASMRALEHYGYGNGTHPNSLMSGLLLCYLELYRQNFNQTYLEWANIEANKILADNYIKYPGFGHCGVDDSMWALAEWAKFNTTTFAQTAVVAAFETHWTSFWGPLSETSDPTNFFHLLKGNHSTHGEFYFWSNRFAGEGDWNVGQNSYYLSAAKAALMAYNLTLDVKYLNFALRQFDWIFGRNPFNMCMFEGLGGNNPSCYHNRAQAIQGNTRGAVWGCVPNGIVRTPATSGSSGDGKVQPDLPWFDLNKPYLEDNSASYESNEPWIPHNLYFVLANSALLAAL